MPPKRAAPVALVPQTLSALGLDLSPDLPLNGRRATGGGAVGIARAASEVDEVRSRLTCPFDVTAISSEWLEASTGGITGAEHPANAGRA